MKNLYPIDQLRPLYATMLDIERGHAAKLIASLSKSFHGTVECDGTKMLATAQRMRWLEGIVEWIERDAAENDGMVDRANLQGHIEARMMQIARGGVWSSNPFKSMMEREELELLARAKEHFGMNIMHPFEMVDEARRSEEWQERCELAHWRIKKGKMYLKVYGGLTRDVEKAMIWTYDKRPALEPGQSYEMVEA